MSLARCLALSLLASTLPLTALQSQAQQAGPYPHDSSPAARPPVRSATAPSHAAPAHGTAAHALASTSTQLPVTSVSLYKNGVGFFEHSGRVTGDQSVTIDFTSSQLNDVLQSLTAIDLNGGRITGAGYNSTTPLDQQLKALPLGLDQAPTADDFYNAIRGAQVSVTGSGAPFTGRVLAYEVTTPAADSKSPALPRRTLTVVSASGAVRSIDLTPSTQVQVVDSGLHTDLNRYLELLDSNRNQDLRHLTLRDTGTGSRDLRVSYISEVPIWKSTYRILFTDAGTNAAQPATLQGWSVVDNTTGEDWNNVQLSLIAGAPQSFIQPLSTPLYSRRPVVPIAQQAQLTPQTFESSDEELKAKVGTATGAGFGGGGFMGDSLRRVVPAQPPPPPPAVATDDALLGETISEDALANLPINGRQYQALAAASIVPNTTTSTFDDFFEYKIAQPVTIRKNESALVPILQTKITAERVTLWSPQLPVPLRALWMTNTSSLTLDRGSFSIVEDGSFAGEGLLDPIHPNERRLLSYAADQAVRVTRTTPSSNSRITEFIIKDGWLRQISSDSRTTRYDIHNAAPESRTVVIEHPVTPNWTLDSTSAKPDETTPTVDRYCAVAAPGGNASVRVNETWLHDQNWHFIETDDTQFGIILHNAAPSPALLAQLQPIVDARRGVSDLDKQIRDKQNAINTLVADQKRLRDNLTALKDTPEQRTLATRYTTELNAQEDQLAALRKDLDALHTKRDAAQQYLNQTIASASIDVKL